MEVFLERLLLELVAIAVQLVVVKFISWLRQRMQASDSQERVPHLAAVA